MWSRRVRAVTVCTLLAAALVPSPSGAAVRAYAVSKGSAYLAGDHELVSPSLVLPQGTELTFLNLHVWGHNITSDAWLTPSERLFRADVVPFRGEAPVRGVEVLAPGTYGFFCSNHMGMRGSVTII